jgi:VanZ family protein
MALVFAVSHIPNHEFPSEIERLPDKALHALEYLPLGFLWARVVPGTARGRFFLGWLAAVLFAVSDEIHQAFVPGRNADWLDVLADTAGSGLGALLCVATWRSKKKAKK